MFRRSLHITCFAAIILLAATAHARHSGDYEPPFGEISMSELARVIQLFNSNALRCDCATEDGYAPGRGDKTCVPHDSDYDAIDWTISLSELLRFIQFFNSPGYHSECESEDNYAPGAGPLIDCREGEGEDVEEGIEMISVPAGSFSMGRTNAGDDATFGNSEELPVHTVTLSTYHIEKYEVTNQQVCDVYNYAFCRGYFNKVNAITAEAFGQTLISLGSSACHIQFNAGEFSPETRTGLPGTTTYSMGTHPMQSISWYGAVAFCNWLSEMEDLSPIYNTTTWMASFGNNGYHLPTEAQWERAAAWDGTKHWIYGFLSDTLTGMNRANCSDISVNDVNPLGLTTDPTTSPVGWFNGVNMSPNGSITTVNSMSPAGAYDMSGNVWEWCHDWYLHDYYATGPGTDPMGPASSRLRVFRGGSWVSLFNECRCARRTGATPDSSGYMIGFRVSRTP